MNRSISWLILSFVATSLLATTLPLLEAGGGRELVATVGRGDSLRLYALVLVAFSSIVLPAFLKRGEGSLRAWATVAALVLLFATIPLLFTAYISGVSARGLLCVGAICAAAAGLPLALTRLWPRRGCVLSQMVAALTLFAVPITTRFLQSLDRSAPALWSRLSVVGLVERFTLARETPHPMAFVAVPVILWAVALLPRPRRRSGAAAGVLLATLVLGAAMPSSASLEVTLRSESGGVGRAGCRVPLSIAVRGPAPRAELRVGSWSAAVPTGGETRILVVPGPEDRELVVRCGAERRSLRLPVELIPRTRLLVGFALPESRPLPQTPEAWHAVRLGLEGLIGQPAALESFDALVLGEEASLRLAREPKLRATLDHFVLAGGTLIRRGVLREDRRRASGRSIVLRGSDPLPELQPSRARDAFDLGLWKTFAPPRWQEMDLSALLLFALIYHLAFLLAFLLPLLLDARKTVGVYLVSVGFVVLVVFLLAYNVLGRIFLKDNQVYTQGVSLLWVERPVEGEPSKLLARRFLCFASMSSEERDLEFPRASDPLLYRDPRLDPAGTLEHEGAGTALRSVALDRFRKKVLLRVDDVLEAPLRLSGNAREGFRLELIGGAPDALGILESRVRGAQLIENLRRTRSYRADGQRLVPVEDGPEALDEAQRVLAVKKMLGRFGPSGRYLLVTFDGLRRPDDVARYLWTRDLGAWMVIPL